ncbi:MAG: PIN domain-containing protein [Anaerolinea sp.]|nr:PIN domain-containing protein [Anaerolinea sp.]
MPERQPIVIDTNILFSALLRSESHFTRTILGSGETFFICESAIVELFKHKERIVQISRLTETEVIRLFYILLRHVTIAKEDLIDPAIRHKAYELCLGIDEADTPHVALALHLNGLLWTGDKTLRQGLEKQGFDRFFDHTHASR